MQTSLFSRQAIFISIVFPILLVSQLQAIVLSYVIVLFSCRPYQKSCLLFITAYYTFVILLQYLNRVTYYIVIVSDLVFKLTMLTLQSFLVSRQATFTYYSIYNTSNIVVSQLQYYHILFHFEMSCRAQTISTVLLIVYYHTAFHNHRPSLVIVEQDHKTFLCCRKLCVTYF